MNKLIVIKIGGAGLKDTTFLPGVASGVKDLIQQGNRVVLVHGGGPEINKSLEAAGITWEFINGQRVTTLEMMNVIDMALTKVNLTICQALEETGLIVTPIKGNEHQLLRCSLLAPELKQVGKVALVNTDYITGEMFKHNGVPVICPLGVLADNTSCNINADYAASEIASQLKADELIFLTDTDGVLDSNKVLFEHLTSNEMNELIKVGVIYGGMLAKINSVQNALSHGVNEVVITHAKNAHQLGTRFTGTICTLSAENTEKLVLGELL